MGHFWLEYEHQGHRQRQDFQQQSVSIGRDGGADLHLDHPTVSRQHALIVENYGAHQLVVLSKNGLTAIDGQVVTGTADLRPGMTIQVGEIQLGYRAAIGGAGGNVGEVATEAISLSQFGSDAPTGAIPVVEESTAPAHSAWNNSPQGSGFANNPQGSGFGQMPVQGFGNAQGSGFGQMPVGQPAQPANGFNTPGGSGFGQMPAQPAGQVPAPAAAAPKKKEEGDDFKIKSWEEIAAEAATGSHQAVSGSTDFERIQKAQAKAAKKNASNPAQMVMLLLAVGALAFALFYEPDSGPVDTGNTGQPDRCKGLKICYPVEAEPSCANKSDCVSKAQQAYKVANELNQKRDVDITNRYEAYKQLDKAGRYMAKASLEAPPDSMKDYDARLAEYEAELEQIAKDHRIRHHQLQQRNMHWEVAENVRAWQAYFPDSYNVWFQEAIEEERRMKDRGTWPKDFPM